jgi:hypothetical protein
MMTNLAMTFNKNGKALGGAPNKLKLILNIIIYYAFSRFWHFYFFNLLGIKEANKNHRRNIIN